MTDSRRAAEYVLPLRWESDDGLDELVGYLRRLSELVDVTVVDGSPELLSARHRAAMPGCRHIAPGDWPGANGKVRAVMAGLQAARHEYVVIADDDVRYDAETLDAVLERLTGSELVRPQNVFHPAPWHARWDTGRTLLNRVGHGDYSGTVAVRRSFVLAYGGYDGDVLFENLELERTIRSRGGRVDVASDVFVARRPPTVEHFWGQRVRQAYDDFAQPLRLAVHLGILPLLVLLACARRLRFALPLPLLAVALAEAGRRRDGGAAEFPASAALWAPVWLAERAVAVWVAVGCRLRGGVRYREARISRAANSPRALRRRP